MQRIQLSGRAVTLRDQQRSNMSSRHLYAPVDFGVLRDELDSRRASSPHSSIDLIANLPPDSDSLRYWRLAEEFLKYGYCEFKSQGTPSICAHMGY